MPLWCYGHLTENKRVVKSPPSFGVTACLQAGCERCAAYTFEGRRGPTSVSAPYPTGKRSVTAGPRLPGHGCNSALNGSRIGFAFCSLSALRLARRYQASHTGAVHGYRTGFASVTPRRFATSMLALQQPVQILGQASAQDCLVALYRNRSRSLVALLASGS